MKSIFSLFKKYKTLTNQKFQKQDFQISAKQNVIPPILWFFIKPISKLSALLVGR
jgi:hypothetical protein